MSESLTHQLFSAVHRCVETALQAKAARDRYEFEYCLYRLSDWQESAQRYDNPELLHLCTLGLMKLGKFAAIAEGHEVKHDAPSP